MSVIYKSQWMVLALLAVVGCSSAQKGAYDVRGSEIEREYVIRERNPEAIPEWVHDFAKWKQVNESKGRHYFMGESGDVNDRIAGCDLAAISAKKKIAQQIAELISTKMAANKQGRLVIDPNDSDDPGIKRAFEEELASKSIAFLSGVKEHGSFWELRDYSKSGGHRRVYSCAKVVMISDRDLEVAIQMSSKKASDVVEDPDAKAAVKEALKNIDRDFVNYQPKTAQ